MVISAVLQSGYGYIGSATKWLLLYKCYIVVIVILTVLHTGYGYISLTT